MSSCLDIWFVVSGAVHCWTSEVFHNISVAAENKSNHPKPKHFSEATEIDFPHKIGPIFALKAEIVSRICDESNTWADCFAHKWHFIWHFELHCVDLVIIAQCAGIRMMAMQLKSKGLDTKPIETKKSPPELTNRKLVTKPSNRFVYSFLMANRHLFGFFLWNGISITCTRNGTKRRSICIVSFFCH